MRKWRLTSILLFVAIMVGCTLGFSSAEGGKILTIYNNGKIIEFDTQPVIVDGRTMVPLRTIFETFGMKVSWDGDLQKITASKQEIEIVLYIGSDKATVNGKNVNLDAQPFLIDNITMVPLRFIAESTGANVAWDSNLYSVIITNKNIDGLDKSALTYKIVDTLQTKLYSDKKILSSVNVGDDFYGQDGNYKGFQPSYKDNKDGTVTDNVTGLMWQKTMAKKMTYDEAVAYANASKLGGYDDWRVSSIKELFSLIIFTGESFGEKAKVLFINTDYFNQPLGDTSIGEREIDAQVWSSTKYVGKTVEGNDTVFGVNYIDGRIKGYPLAILNSRTIKKGYFRLVRGNENYGKNIFMDNGDGTISDLATGLMWQKADDGKTRDWKDALKYAESLKLAGHDDWRLPNAKELQSIVDYTKSIQTTGTAAIDSVFILTSITDPNGHLNYGYYWSGTTHQDGSNISDSAVYVAFGEAQGKMFGKVLDVHGAGAVRSDPKSGNPSDYPEYFGPQGDLRYGYNFTLAVRSIN